MLVLFPILMLAYGVLYAFASPIPQGSIQMDVRDALVPSKLPLKIGIPISSNSQSYVKRSPSDLDPDTFAARNSNPTTWENVGFYHSCKSASPACSGE